MTRRQLAAVLILSGLIVSAGPTALLVTRVRPLIDDTSFVQIVRSGASRDDLIAAAGRPAIISFHRHEKSGELWEFDVWTTSERRVEVIFFPDGWAGSCSTYTGQAPTLWDRIVSRLPDRLLALYRAYGPI